MQPLLTAELDEADESILEFDDTPLKQLKWVVHRATCSHITEQDRMSARLPTDYLTGSCNSQYIKHWSPIYYQLTTESV